MNDMHSGTLRSEGTAALGHMEQALELLDQCSRTGEIGAQLDLAICRLRELIVTEGLSEVTASVSRPLAS
ncbi:hypothetical protein [Sphingomonas limnosediminicola]|uniref:hypothetical protein n=1 Tax=Sphingomonas limnosediminicola TaxID=940133 RepID=UPI0031D29C8E